MFHPTAAFFLGAISTFVVFTAQGEICFKKFNPLKPGCHRELRHKQLPSPDECCASGGQGYTSKLRLVGQTRKWYECTPCPRFEAKSLKPVESESHNEVIGDDKGFDPFVDQILKSLGSEVPDLNQTPTKLRERLKNKTLYTKEELSGATLKTPMWTEWSAWGPCTGSCGTGSQQRARLCLRGACKGEDMQQRECVHLIPCPVDGGWGDWHDWEACSVTCGSGTQIRIRKCDKPEPAYGGKECEGVSEQSQHCVADPCPVNGGWSDWGEWTPCNVTCGVGHQERMRRCDNPPPEHGGALCEGDWIDVRTCITNEQCSVDGAWCDWGEWTTCLSSGFQTAFRACECPRPQFGGEKCKGRYVKKRHCEPSNEEDIAPDEYYVDSEEFSGHSQSSVESGCDEGSGDGSDVNCDQEPDDIEEASYNSEEEEDSFEASGAYIKDA